MIPDGSDKSGRSGCELQNSACGRGKMEDTMDSVRFLLNDNWKFHLGEAEDAWFKGYDDSSWESVTLPHDWSVSQPFSKEYSSGTGYLAGGIVSHFLKNTGERKFPSASTESTKTARSGATATIWEKGRTAMFRYPMISATSPALRAPTARAWKMKSASR